MNLPETAGEIVAGDQVVMFGYVTPAKGVVLTPLTNFDVRDTDRGVITPVNTSVGTWKKLERIRRNPRVALAYHTREHGSSRRPEYVLVQGFASPAAPRANYPASIREAWERNGGPADFGPLWERWLRVWLCRVGIELAVERVLVWPDRSCAAVPSITGAPLPADPPAPQRAPKLGTGPRINHRRAARRARRLPEVLLGWVGADGFPMVVPVDVGETSERGIELSVPEGAIPAGGRRAGLAAHWFARYTFGQHKWTHTGWLESEPGAQRVLYAPHTQFGYRLPTSPLLFKLVAGGMTRRGVREAKRAGFWSAPELPC